MSELQDLLVALDGVTKEAEQHAAQLAQHARQLGQAASSAASATQGSGRADSKQTAAALQSAQRSISQAAQHLHQAALAGKGFVVRYAGGGRAGGPESLSSSPEFGPGSPEPWNGGGPAPSAALGAIASWLGDINPGYTGDPFDPRSSNCGECAAAVFARLEGIYPSAVAGTSTLSVEQMEALTGRPQIPMTLSEMRDVLIAAGPGSHAVVGIDRTFGAGHWFNAYYDGERVVAIDGQSGEILDWPPEYGSPSNPVSIWDMGAPL